MNVEATFLEATIRLVLADPPAPLSVSDGIEPLLGFSPDDFLNAKVSLQSRIHADDRDIAETLFSPADNHSAGTFNIRLRQADGKIRCVRGRYEKTPDEARGSVILEIHLQDAKGLQQNLGVPPMTDCLRAMLENTDDYIYFKDRNHVFIGASQSLASLDILADPARHSADMLGLTDYDLFPEELADAYYRLEKQVFATNTVAHAIQEVRSRDGRKGWVDNRKYPIWDTGGETVGLFGVARDITEFKRIEAELARSQRFSESLLDNLPGIFYLYSYPENRLVRWNKRHETLLGYTTEEMAGRHICDWHLPESREAALAAVEEVMANGQSSIEAPLRAKDGHLVHFALSGVRFEIEGKSYLMGVGIDVTERKRMEEKVHQLAFHDPLTNLPNRRLLNDRLSRAMAAGKRKARYGALMFIDLDNFKQLNDSHGHEVGDLLLIEAAQRLKSCVREMDTVARFGGDEFVVVISELETDGEHSVAQASAIAEKIREALAAPYSLAVRNETGRRSTIQHHCTASIGLTLFLGQTVGQDDILKHADRAMYQAKKSGRNSIQISHAADLEGDATRDTPVGFLQISWHPAYECGNALIDDQHRALFVDANALLNAMLSGQSRDEVMSLTDALIRDIIRHFADEEAIFTAAGFPGAAEHIATHRQLVDNALEMVDRLHAGTLAVGELLQFLACEVIALHMLKIDRQFAPYLKKSG